MVNIIQIGKQITCAIIVTLILCSCAKWNKETNCEFDHTLFKKFGYWYGKKVVFRNDLNDTLVFYFNTPPSITDPRKERQTSDKHLVYTCIRHAELIAIEPISMDSLFIKITAGINYSFYMYYPYIKLIDFSYGYPYHGYDTSTTINDSVLQHLRFVEYDTTSTEFLNKRISSAFINQDYEIVKFYDRRTSCTWELVMDNL